jgi:hypothetical protein
MVFSRVVIGPYRPMAGVPIIEIDPPNPSIPNWTPLGAIVATITVTMTGGSPFTGTVVLTDDDGGIYAIAGSNPWYLIINPDGPGVGPEGGTLSNVTVVATQ